MCICSPGCTPCTLCAAPCIRTPADNIPQKNKLCYVPCFRESAPHFLIFWGSHFLTLRYISCHPSLNFCTMTLMHVAIIHNKCHIVTHSKKKKRIYRRPCLEFKPTDCHISVEFLGRSPLMAWGGPASPPVGAGWVYLYRVPQCVLVRLTYSEPPVGIHQPLL